MLVLGIDASAGPASAAVAQDGRLLGEFFVNTKQTHSQTLLPMTEALLSSLGLACKDLDSIAVTHGPGSFTGIRIGVACVKGIAFPFDIPCCAISTLEAIAYGGLCCKGDILCAVMDARCGQVYQALFEAGEHGLVRLTEDRAVSIQELGEECREYGERLAPENTRFQRAGSVALLAAGRPTVSAEELLPMYLRMPQAERELKAKQEQGKG